MSQHGTTSTAPANNKAIRGAEQSGNIAKQQFAGMVKRLEADMAIWEA